MPASPWLLGGLSVAVLGRRVWNGVLKNDVIDRAASLSYYFLFAIFPTLLFLTTLLGLLPVPDLMKALLGYIDRVLPYDAASLVRKTLADVVMGASGGLLSIGVLAALWGASSGMASIVAALNATHDVVDNRAWWVQRLSAIGVTIAFSIFTVSALLLVVFGEWIGEAVASWIGVGPQFTVMWNVLQWPAVIVFMLTGVALVYYLAPAGPRQWRWATPGSVFALVGWLVTSLGLRLYVTIAVRIAGDYNATYGSIGGVILLMLWLYLSGVALLIGARIDAEIARAAARTQRWNELETTRARRRA